MSNKYIAHVTWISAECGGRQSIPISDKYAPILRIPSDRHGLTDNWGAFVTNVFFLSDIQTIAVIKYLSNKAPDRLHRGVTFELYEGPRLVAKGIVVYQINNVADECP